VWTSALAVLVGLLVLGPTAPAGATTTGDANASPAAIAGGGTSTVTLSLTGTNHLVSTPTDVVFVVDESGSIDSDEFQDAAGFAKDVYDALVAAGLHTNGGTAAVVKYSNSARLTQPPSSDPARLESALTTRAFPGGSTATNTAMATARTALTGLPASHHRIMIVLTDGYCTCTSTDLTAQATADTDAGITTWAVGYADARFSELTVIAGGDGSQVLQVDEAADLATAVDPLVRAIAVPDATGVSVDVDVDSRWAPSTAAADLGSATLDGQAVHWQVPSLGATPATLTYQVTARPGTCGPTPVNGAVTYADDQRSPGSFPPVTIDVTCATTTSVAVTGGDTIGEPATATATVTDPAAPTSVVGTGAVAFSVDGTPVSGCAAVPVTAGTATCAFVPARAGAVPVSAGYAGGTGYAASDGSTTLAVQRLAQTITFPALPDHVLADSPLDVVATADSGLPVTFSASGACSVAGSTVTLLHTGTCTLEAEQAGDATYLPAPAVEQSFQVLPDPVPTRLTVAPTLLRVSGGLIRITVGIVSARLTRADGTAVPGAIVTFTSAGSRLCSATTAADGTATCTLGLLDALRALLGVDASFAGDYPLLPARGSAGAVG
jgi:hypothetical protein